MLNDNVKKGLIILAIFVGGAAVGRFSLPAKVVYQDHEVIKTVTVTDTKTDTKKQIDEKTDKVTTVTQTEYPDGRKVTTTVTTDKSVSDIINEAQKDTQTKTDETQTKDITKTTTYSKNDWQINAMYTIRPTQSWGLGVQRRILGPFYIGGFYLQTGNTLGASAGISF